MNKETSSEPLDLVDKYFKKGIELFNQNDYTAAILCFDKAINLDSVLDNNLDSILDSNLDSKCAKVYNYRGIAKSKIGKYNGAISDYDKAIELNGAFFQAYYNRSISKGKIEKYFDALTDIELAIFFCRGSSRFRNMRGVIKGKLGFHKEAITDFDTAIEVNPKLIIAYYNRGIAKRLIGRKREGDRDLQEGLYLAEEEGDERLKAKIRLVMRG
ncbi:MAG: hypothetical protein OXM61_17180 [Candidatus Poribacteria bacterium]|nr:hypothetical protein [Candidatus Poribacteria bacterium]